MVVRFEFDTDNGVHILVCFYLFEKVDTALALGEYVLGDRVGNFRVVREAHGGGCTTEVMVRRAVSITEHFGKGSLGL